MEHPPLPENHWLWRRLMAFLALLAMVVRAHYGAPDYEIWAYVFLCAQWAIPAAVEDVTKIVVSRK